jgi:hypothetical protein
MVVPFVPSDLAVRALDTLLPALRIGLLYLTANRAHWAPLAVNAELVFSGVPVLNFLSALAQLATAATQYLAGMELPALMTQTQWSVLS